MHIQNYIKGQFLEMDPMHDCNAVKIALEGKTLIVMYDELDEGVLGDDGEALYKNKRLTVKYKFDTFCNARMYYGKNKYKDIDMFREMSKFDKITKNWSFDSYSYSVDYFYELILNFDIVRRHNGRLFRNKYYSVDIRFDVINVEYTWD